MRVQHPVERTRSFRLGPELNLAEVTAGLGSLTAGRDYTEAQPFLTALGLLTSEPGWHFRPTLSAGIDGSHPLMMIVRVPPDQPMSANITVSAVVRRRRLLWYRAEPISPVVIVQPAI
ncbi:hypothetical protein ACFQZ4_43620 [Catellatospora coxensis]